MTPNKPVNILLVEDDPGHARLVEKNLRRANITNDIFVFPDGQAALDYLFTPREHELIHADDPMLILLDLNMPIMDGYQVLWRIKADERTKHIPVIILTTTFDKREITRCYELGCNIYITKPVDYQQFSEAINKLGSFLGIMTMPDGLSMMTTHEGGGD
jgi:CheY-like chemotaxis protein